VRDESILKSEGRNVNLCDRSGMPKSFVASHFSGLVSGAELKFFIPRPEQN